eukprot:TRINITY_DN30816_c0_g1_i1.p1 TRINITY_DN30816_c0_g1~~TRINITY_DN30816_c0_g1_i1.p1  ORF type:complete len:279 (+),score=60.13 TRINITY_DN30816_c0_g1_i1:135-971(+)
MDAVASAVPTIPPLVAAPSSQAGLPAAPPWLDTFALLDKNHDGFISREEWQAASGALAIPVPVTTSAAAATGSEPAPVASAASAGDTTAVPTTATKSEKEDSRGIGQVHLESVNSAPPPELDTMTTSVAPAAVTSSRSASSTLHARIRPSLLPPAKAPFDPSAVSSVAAGVEGSSNAAGGASLASWFGWLGLILGALYILRGKLKKHLPIEAHLESIQNRFRPSRGTYMVVDEVNYMNGIDTMDNEFGLDEDTRLVPKGVGRPQILRAAADEKPGLLG